MNINAIQIVIVVNDRRIVSHFHIRNIIGAASVTARRRFFRSRIGACIYPKIICRIIYKSVIDNHIESFPFPFAN
jgi:hypothetical protein